MLLNVRVYSQLSFNTRTRAHHWQWTSLSSLRNSLWIQLYDIVGFFFSYFLCFFRFFMLVSARFYLSHHRMSSVRFLYSTQWYDFTEEYYGLNVVLSMYTSPLSFFAEAKAAEPSYIIKPFDVTTELGWSVNFTCGIKISTVKKEQDTIRLINSRCFNKVVLLQDW